jgi:hypothetical protein
VNFCIPNFEQLTAIILEEYTVSSLICAGIKQGKFKKKVSNEPRFRRMKILTALQISESSVLCLQAEYFVQLTALRRISHLIIWCKSFESTREVLYRSAVSSCALIRKMVCCSQHGSIYSGLYSCSTGYFREFCLVILTLIAVEFNYFEGRCYLLFGGGG